MIDARVDDAVKQHNQKMDWLRGEEEALSLTPPPAAGAGSGGKMGFNLPLSEAPQAQEVIAPVLEIKQEGEVIPSDIDQLAQGKSAVPAEEDCAKAEATTPEESLSQPAAPDNNEVKTGKDDKTGTSPSKDGTPV